MMATARITRALGEQEQVEKEVGQDETGKAS